MAVAQAAKNHGDERGLAWYLLCVFFFSIWVFFHEHSRITELQRKGEGISLTPHYHFNPLHRHF